MEIRNLTEFRNFAIQHQLIQLHKDIESVSLCATDYERGCNCWKKEDRQKIYNNCKALYVKAVGTVVRSFPAQFSSHAKDRRIVFMQDGIPIGTAA